MDHDTVLSNDTTMAAKYRETIQRHIFKGPADSGTGRVLMIMVRRHPSFVFTAQTADVTPGQINELGVVVHARPEKLPQHYGDEFLEVLRDKLAEIREEFSFGIEIMRVVQS